MNIELGDNLNAVIRLAIADALTSKLDKVLPTMVEKILTDKPSYGKNVMEQAIHDAVAEEANKQLMEAIDARKRIIAMSVTKSLENVLTAESVEKYMVEALENFKMVLKPFGKKARGRVMEEEE